MGYHFSKKNYIEYEFYVQDPDTFIKCTPNFNYTAAIILQLSELFLDALTLNFQDKCVWFFRHCLCIKTFSAGIVISKQIFFIMYGVGSLFFEIDRNRRKFEFYIMLNFSKNWRYRINFRGNLYSASDLREFWALQFLDNKLKCFAHTW